MERRQNKFTPFMLIVLILFVISAVVILRAGLPWQTVLGDRNAKADESPAASATVTSGLLKTPVATGVLENPNATPTSDPGSDLTTIPCFIFEQLPPIAFVPDGSELMVRVSSGVQVFNLATGSLENYIKSSQQLTAAALSPSGETLAWALADNTIQLVQVSEQKVLQTLSGHTDTVTKLSFSPDGNLLVSASHDHTVKEWNVAGDELRSIETDALGIGISADGTMLATVPFDGPVALWNLASGEKIKDLGGYGGYDTSDAVFSPDGQYLAADLASGLFLWKISDGSLLWNGTMNSMAVSFSPDGQYLAYSDINANNTVMLASATSIQPIREIDEMKSPVWDLFFSPDASLLSITDGREIHIRQVESGELLAIGKAVCP